MPFRRGLAVAACAALAVPQLASAEGSRIALRWSAPASCPDVDLVRARALALAGPDVDVDADAKVTELPGEFRVVLYVRVGGTAGERLMSAPSCDAVSEAVAVVLALSGTSAPPSPPVAPPIAPPVVASPPAVPDPPPPAVPDPPARPLRESPAQEKDRHRPYVRISAEAALDVGTLPVGTYGARLRAAFLPRPGVTVGLAGAVWANQVGTLSGSSQGADFSLLSFDAFGCYGLLRTKMLELSPCLVVQVDRISAAGVNETNRGTAAPLWLSVGVGLEGRWELTRTLALTLELHAVVPTEGQSFVITGPRDSILGTVHATSVVAGRGYFGPEVRF